MGEEGERGAAASRQRGPPKKTKLGKNVRVDHGLPFVAYGGNKAAKRGIQSRR